MSTPAELEEALEGALATFAAFETIMHAVSEDTPGILRASAINSEAGDHPIPQDPGLVELAIRSANRATELFPYLSFRFGARGLRFARSDSAWLLTLLELDERGAERQVDWLTKLLAARGIPSLCLEAQLQLLAKALERERGSESGARLRRLARHAARHRSGAKAWSSAGRRSPQVPELGEQIGALLHCAVVDERSGIGDCASNIRTWAGSEPRLSEDARREIEVALAAAFDALPS